MSLRPTPDICFPLGRDFVNRLLAKDPKERLSLTAALGHPFLREDTPLIDEVEGFRLYEGIGATDSFASSVGEAETRTGTGTGTGFSPGTSVGGGEAAMSGRPSDYDLGGYSKSFSRLKLEQPLDAPGAGGLASRFSMSSSSGDFGGPEGSGMPVNGDSMAVDDDQKKQVKEEEEKEEKTKMAGVEEGEGEDAKERATAALLAAAGPSTSIPYVLPSPPPGPAYHPALVASPRRRPSPPNGSASSLPPPPLPAPLAPPSPIALASSPQKRKAAPSPPPLSASHRRTRSGVPGLDNEGSSDLSDPPDSQKDNEDGGGIPPSSSPPGTRYRPSITGGIASATPPPPPPPTATRVSARLRSKAAGASPSSATGGSARSTPARGRRSVTPAIAGTGGTPGMARRSARLMTDSSEAEKHLATPGSATKRGGGSARKAARRE